MYKIAFNPDFGRGLFATKDIAIDQRIASFELLVLNERDTELVNKTDLQFYTFKYNETQDCLVLGDGELFNHSDNPNVKFNLVDFDCRKIMQFVAIKDIKEGEQLFISYNQDTEVDTSEYINKKSLI